jgi:hypothetical protein
VIIFIVIGIGIGIVHLHMREQQIKRSHPQQTTNDNDNDSKNNAGVPAGTKMAPSTHNVAMTHHGSNIGYHALMRCCRSAVSRGRLGCAERGTTDSSSSAMVKLLALPFYKILNPKRHNGEAHALDEGHGGKNTRM